jgi:hypothetical protein
MKQFWNVARMKNLTTSEREALIKTIMSKMKGNILQVTLRHDASRAVQCILQFGSAEQRRQILSEMGDRMSEVGNQPDIVVIHILYDIKSKCVNHRHLCVCLLPFLFTPPIYFSTTHYNYFPPVLFLSDTRA